MTRQSKAAPLLLFVTALAGCASATPNYYTLDATGAAAAPALAQTAIVVGPVTIPATVDRTNMVVQTAPNQVQIEEYQRWAGPLSELIAQAVAGDLSRMLGTQQVATGMLANFAPEYQVAINVQRFDSSNQTALLDAIWTVRRAGKAQARSGRTLASEPVSGDGGAALAAAHSRALAQLSGDIAAAIRSASQ